MAAPTTTRDGNDNRPYDDGGGYGKARKRPFHRGQTKPYDRPSTSIRNPGILTANRSGNGWFSKLVDPAQKLISSGAHRFFASVFRKRLGPPPPTQPLQPELERGTKDKQVEIIPKDKQGEIIPKDKQGETNPMLSSKVLVGSNGETRRMYHGPSSSSGGGVTDLESMLQDKSFTRDEIDRLTALLRSRRADLPLEDGKNSEVPSSSFRLRDKEELPRTPVKVSGIRSHLISTPVVLDQDVASPAELAQAYMGSRPSKVSPSMLGLPCQPWKEDSALQSRQTFLSKGPTPSSIYRSSGQPGLTDNGFMTPRSRGRSAVYSMARSPYARTHSTNIIQDSPSHSALGNSRVYGSKRGTLKRRSYVLDNDMGSSSPIRRIRQKSNLMPTVARGTRFTSDAEKHISLISKPALEVEPSKEDGDISIQSSGFTRVSSKSSEMGSKILQQLDVLVSSRAKSPAKLPLEKIDSTKFLDSVQNTIQTNATDVVMLDDSQTIEPISPSKVNYFSSKLGTAKTVEARDGASNRGVDSANKSSQLKKLGFRTSADEDLLENVDGDGVGNHPTGGKDNMRLVFTSFEGKAAEVVKMGEPSVFSEVNPLSNSTPIKKDTTTSEPTVLGNSKITSSRETVKHSATISQSISASDKAVSGIFRAALQAENNGANEKAPVFSSASPPTAANDSIGIKLSASGSKSESSQRIVTAAATVDPVVKQPEVDKSVGRNEPGVSFLNIEIAPASVVASSPAGGMFSFGSGPQNGNLPGSSTGETVSNSSLSVVPKGAIATEVSVNAVNAGSNSVLASALAPSMDSSIFKFGSSPTSVSVPFASDNASSAGNSQNKRETSFGSSASVASGDIKPALTSSSSGSCLVGVSTTSKIADNSTGGPSSDTLAAEKRSTLWNPFGGTGASNTSKIADNSTGGPSSDTMATEKRSTLWNPFGGTGASDTSKIADNSIGGPSSDTLATEKKSTLWNPFGGTGASNTTVGSSLFGGTATSDAVASTSPLGDSGSAGTSTGGGLPGTTGGLNNGNSIFNATTSSVTTGSSPFSFSVKPSLSGVSNQSQDMKSSLGTPQEAATGSASSSLNTISQFGSAVPSSPFGLNSSGGAASSSSLYSSSSASKLFSSGASFGVALEPNSVSSSASTSSPLFGSSWSTPSLPVFGSMSSSSASSSGFVFGASSGPATAGASVFGSSANAMSNSPFSFSATPANPSTLSVFTTPDLSYAFTSAPSGNNNQMSMEDSMAEDTVHQATTPSVPLFGQPTAATSSSGFVFGSAALSTGGMQFGTTTPSMGNPQFGETPPSASQQFGAAAAAPGIPFQFGGQPNMPATPQQNASPFQASGSLEFNEGGSFSLGAGDKSNRRIIRVKRNTRRK